VVTFLSMLLLYLFNEWIICEVYISYALSYVITIGVSYVLNMLYVFRTKLTLKGILLYYMVYISSMLLGLGLLWLFTILLPNLNRTIISYMVIPFTMIYNYLFADKISVLVKKN